MSDTSNNALPRLVGMNHIALEVGDIDEALEFYGRLFDIRLRGHGDGRAFIDMGDQFIALFEGDPQNLDGHRHFGLVVDDRDAVRARLKELAVPVSSGRFLEFRDPWGNRIQVVAYADIQYTKAPEVMSAMGIEIEKSEGAKQQLREKGMAPDR